MNQIFCIVKNYRIEADVAVVFEPQHLLISAVQAIRFRRRPRMKAACNVNITEFAGQPFGSFNGVLVIRVNAQKEIEVAIANGG